MKKTEGFSIYCSPIESIPIKWNPDEFKYLGVILTKIPEKSLKLNLEKAMKIFKTSLEAWQHRKLTFTGKKLL